MIAVDTCVLARYVTQDDDRQAQIATNLLREPCFVSDTVLLELAWLLASRFAFGRDLLAATLTDLVRLPVVHVSNPQAIAWAIDRFRDGADSAT